ncbi:hypothetical protein HWV62_16458 [Athelia sp. TMB]|nr:hypothetical protein HWV62_16458 [Athelia sp. TMB]
MSLIRAFSQVFYTEDTSGGTVNNIHGNYIDNQVQVHGDYIASAQVHINFTVESASERENILEHIREAYSIRPLNAGQSASQVPPSNTHFIMPGPSAIDRCYTSSARSIIELRLMMDVVRIMINNPKLCSSARLSETLAALERVLILTELSVRAYHNTPLYESLSHGISVEVDECRRLLEELLGNLSNYRHILSSAVLYFIRKYVWHRVGRGGVVENLDLELRRSHRSFAACLLALGR